eukprot:934612-Ditylum_brightwellii.AAC.1
MDSKFLEAIMGEMSIYILCNANHGHDKKAGRSITGLFSIVGLAPITWMSKQQSCAHTSTFGSEFTALKAVVEEA